MKDKLERQETPPIKCPYCHGPSAFFLSSSDVNRQTTPDIFHLYRCSVCELVFLDPIPEDMRPFYRGGYQPIPKTLEQLKAIAEGEEYKMEPLLKYKKSGKLLEIGPWMGVFSWKAKDAGFDVTAIEIDQQCVDFLTSVVGVRAIQSSDPEATLSAMEEQFDVIALWHSLEHLPRPWEVIKRAAERLAPGGILLIAIPNIESYDFLELKKDWLHLDTPRHLFFYTGRSLEKLCLANGLETLALVTGDQLSRILSKAAWCRRAASIVPIKYVRRILGELLYRIALGKSRGNGSGLTAAFAKPN